MREQKGLGWPWVLPFGEGSMGGFFLGVKGFLMAIGAK